MNPFIRSSFLHMALIIGASFCTVTCSAQSLTCTNTSAYQFGGFSYAPLVNGSWFYTSNGHVWSAPVLYTELFILGMGQYTSSTPIPINNSVLASGPLASGAPIPLSLEGQDISVQMRLGIINGSYSVVSPVCHLQNMYVDLIEPEMFTVQTEVNCITGLSRIILSDNPMEVGDITIGSRGDHIAYSVKRNGVSVASGNLLAKRVAIPPSFVFDALPGGDYEIGLQYPIADGNSYPGSMTLQTVLPNQGDCGVNVSMRAALQGALPSGTLMGDGLRSSGLIPTIEPYSTLGYTYVGTTPGASINPTLLATTENNAIVDWVVVELRSGTNPAQVLFSRPALLQRDGDIMDLDGDGYVNFPNAGGSYHVALRHRNHLGVMTSTPRALTMTPITVDFRSASTGCYGTTPRAQVGTVYCLWSGDGNGNGNLQYTGAGNDRDPILIAVGNTTPNNSLTGQYNRMDVNMDGVVKYTGANNDRDPILLNVGSTTPNNTRVQQLP